MRCWPGGHSFRCSRYFACFGTLLSRSHLRKHPQLDPPSQSSFRPWCVLLNLPITTLSMPMCHSYSPSRRPSSHPSQKHMFACCRMSRSTSGGQSAGEAPSARHVASHRFYAGCIMLSLTVQLFSLLCFQGFAIPGRDEGAGGDRRGWRKL